MNWKKLLTVAVVVSLALMIAVTPLLSAGCAGGKEKTTLKVGFSICYTGPAAEKGRPMGDAKLDCMKYINEELGGVAGHQVEVIWRDTEYDAAKAATIVNELMAKGCLLFTTNASKDMTASMEIANRAAFPGFTVYGAPANAHPPKHIYVQMPDYGDDWAAFAKYYLENIWKGPGKPKMALHLLSNPTGAGAKPAVQALADTLGIEIVATEEHAETTISEIESLTRIKALKADVLYISSTPKPAAVIIKNAMELGMYPGVTIGLCHAAITSKLIEFAGADIVEGVYGVFPTVKWGDNVPAMAKMTEYCQKYHPDNYGNMDYITSWAEGLIVAEILRLAVEHVGVDNIDKLTPQTVEEYGFKKLNNFDVGGLHGPVSYTPGDNRLSKSLRVFQVKKGQITPVTGWIEAPLIKYEDFDWFGK